MACIKLILLAGNADGIPTSLRYVTINSQIESQIPLGAAALQKRQSRRPLPWEILP